MFPYTWCACTHPHPCFRAHWCSPLVQPCSPSRSPSSHHGTLHRSHHYLFYQHSGHRPHGQSFSDHITFVHADTFYSIFRHHSNEPNHSTFVVPALRTQPPFSTRQRFRLCTPPYASPTSPVLPARMCDTCYTQIHGTAPCHSPPRHLRRHRHLHALLLGPLPRATHVLSTTAAASGSFTPQLKQRLHLRPNPRPRIKFRTLPASITAHSPLSLSFPISLSLSLSFPPATHQAWAG
jgi:hypothetical protein